HRQSACGLLPWKEGGGPLKAEPLGGLLCQAPPSARAAHHADRERAEGSLGHGGRGCLHRGGSPLRGCTRCGGYQEFHGHELLWRTLSPSGGATGIPWFAEVKPEEFHLVNCSNNMNFHFGHLFYC